MVLVMKDKVGAMSKILKNITRNIVNLYMRRVNAAENIAIGIIEMDENLPKEDLKKVEECDYVYELFYIPRD
ncbi:hypothetical protein ABOONEI_240 [Aciduliprofundum boonei T469]|nr:hypothetical protein ABOONEI_240 [Aciduliprofundum boonei T469]